MEIYKADEVTEEIVEAFQNLIPQLSSSSQAPGLTELQEIIDSPSTMLFIAKEDGKIVGSLSLVVFRIPTGVRAWIEDVIVDKDFRGRGIGKALVQRALDQATELRAKTVDLTSRPKREEANRLYPEVGFQMRETNLYRYKIK